MFCQNCGKELPKEAKFCQYCGHGVNGASNTQAQNVQVVQIIKPKEPKNKTLAIVLLLFLGLLGVHDFYLEAYGRGATKVLITIFLGWFFGIGLVINGIWCLVDLFAICSNNGYNSLLTDEELEQKRRQKQVDDYNERHYEHVSSYEELEKVLEKTKLNEK